MAETRVGADGSVAFDVHELLQHVPDFHQILRVLHHLVDVLVGAGNFIEQHLRVAILDPALTVSQPRSITAISGFDAIAHAVETYVTTKRNPVSEIFSREAWRLLEPNYERVLSQPHDLEARGAMQLGAFYAGMAIENSMLGATHACANPLTAHYGTAHGAAIAMLLPSVVRWNERAVAQRYESLFTGTEALARRLEQLAEAGGLRVTLSASGVAKNELPALAAEAAEQWTGTFNPHPFDQKGAMEVYEWAY